MVVKGPSSGQDIYDTPASTDKNTQQTVSRWDFLDLENFFVCHRCAAWLLILCVREHSRVSL